VALEDEGIGQLRLVVGKDPGLGEIPVEPVGNMAIDRASVAFKKAEPFLKVQNEGPPHLEKGKIRLVPDDGIPAGGELEIDVVPRPAVIDRTRLEGFAVESDFIF